MKIYWWKTTYKNFGDELTPIVLEHFLPDEKIELAKRDDKGKVLGIGSIMASLQDGDYVWGAGSNQPNRTYKAVGAKIFAIRGPKSLMQIEGKHQNVVFGDPALLIPLIYNPEVKKTHKVGYLPHYVDKAIVAEHLKNADQSQFKMIDIQADWKKVIEEVKSCETIVASSLHGIICAEAYGIPAIWEKYTDKIRGGDFKFQDYFLGTGREEQRKGEVIPPIKDLPMIQGKLLGALEALAITYKNEIK